MYSLILMSALTAAPDSPEFNGFFRNLFNFRGSDSTSSSAGCNGSCYGSCSGKSNACYGSCTGCNGSIFGNRLRAFTNRNSCYGSCSGKSNACYGSCTGCTGGCTGSYSCGGGFPSQSFDGYAMPAPATYGMPSGDCAGCGPAVPYYGSPSVPSPIPPLPMNAIPPAFDTNPQAIPRPASPPSSIEDSSRFGTSTGYSTNGRATVVVRLPADATLFADGKALALTSSERTFVTPVLPDGSGFQYAFRVEYQRDGETISQTKRVSVRPGVAVAVEFNDLTVAKRTGGENDVTAKPAAPKVVEPAPVVRPNPFLNAPSTVPADRARITVKVPPGVTLFVDDKKNERTEPVREFATPPLPPGQEFAYLMKAERLRDGRPELQIQKVVFRAGEIVTVDFSNWTGK